jgi:hypothetical protein
MKLTVEGIKALNPCQSRLNNFLAHYPNFKGSLVKFMKLDSITDLDKIWVAIRVMPLDELQYFSIDCVFSAAYAAYAADAYAAAYDAAYAYAAAADTAYAYAAAAAAAGAYAYAAADTAAYERKRQVEAIIYLCKGM